MLRDGQEVSIDVVPFDSTQRTYVIKDSETYKIDDGTSVIYGGVSGIMKGYRVFLGVDNVQVTLEEGESLTIKDNKYFSGVETVTTVYTTPTNDIDVTYNAIDIQRMNASQGSGFLDIVSSDITVSGMTVTIQPQRACIDGITVNAKEAVQLAIDNGLSQLRTDLIVLRKTQSTASSDYFVKKGELGSTTPPALEQVAMGVYEIPVCSIRVNANQTTLELSNITDLRNYLTRERDKPVEDNGTGINPLQSSTFILTNTSTTRTLSNGLWTGQEVKLFNSTANSITIESVSGEFTLTAARNYTKLIWSGSKWLRGVEIPIGTTLWLTTNDDPSIIFGGEWDMIGSKDRALVSGNGSIGNAIGKLPEIDGSMRCEMYEGNPFFTEATEAFIVTNTSTGSKFGPGGSGNSPNYQTVTFKASNGNPDKYSTSKNELIIPDGLYVNGWTKIAF